MIQRRALAAGIATKISCHSFRATGITTYLQTEVPQQMADHESTRTTGLYDRRRNDTVTSTKLNGWCIKILPSFPCPIVATVDLLTKDL
jgi:integrase